MSNSTGRLPPCRFYGAAAKGPANTALLLNALLAVPEGEEITPAQLREQTGLTQNQYKEAIRVPSVKELFHTEFITFGSGKNQKIRRAPTTKVA